MLGLKGKQGKKEMMAEPGALFPYSVRVSHDERVSSAHSDKSENERGRKKEKKRKHALHLTAHLE